MASSRFWSALIGFFDLTKYFFIVVAIIIVCIVFLGVPLMVKGESMMYNFETGEVVLVEKMSYYDMSNIKRSDVVAAKFPADPKKTRLIKRVIGLPGDTVETRAGLMYLNDKLLDEPYQPIVGAPPYQEIGKITLKEDEYYLCGDNRPGSSDSRLWGPVLKSDIQGRVAFVLFPLFKAKYIDRAN